MKYLMTPFFLFITCQLVFGQSVEWESFLQADRAGEPLETEGRIWVPTTAGLVEYNRTTATVLIHNKATAGLVSNSIEAVAQHPLTSDLYIGTYDLALMVQPSGSNTWEHLPYPESFHTGQGGVPQTYCLAFDQAGTLWVGTDIGLLSYNEEGWTRWENNESPFYGAVWDLDFSLSGDLLVASHGVFRKEGEELFLLSPGEETSGEPLFAYGGSAVFQGQDGQIWFFTDIGTVGVYDGAAWSHITHLPQLNIFGASLSILEPGPGQLRVTVPTRAQYFWDGEAWTEEGSFEDLQDTYRKHQLHDGTLLTVSATDIHLEEVTVPYSSYPFAGPLFQFRNDESGQLWAKDQSERVLNMATGEHITAVDEEGAPFPFGRYTFAADGSFWCTAGHSVQHWSGESWTVYSPSDSSFPEIYGWELYPGLSGSEVWMTTYEEGLYHFSGGEWQPQNHPAFSELYIADMAAVPGGLWVNLVGGGEARIAFWDGVSLTMPEHGEQGYEDLPVSDLQYEAGTGRFWVLGYDKLQYLENGVWYSYELPFGPSNDSFFRELLLQDGRKVIWDSYQVAVESGEEWAVYNPVNSPMDNLRLTGAGLDANGELWLSHGNRSVTERVKLGALTSSGRSLEPVVRGLDVLGNPVREGQLVLKMPIPVSSGARLQVLDGMGRSIGLPITSTADRILRVNLGNLPTGWYIVVVFENGQQFTAPFVVAE